jgi:hypothetical protein
LKLAQLAREILPEVDRAVVALSGMEFLAKPVVDLVDVVPLLKTLQVDVFHGATAFARVKQRVARESDIVEADLADRALLLL